MSTIWLSSSVFSMEAVQDAVKRLDKNNIFFAYREWEHAEARLQGNPTEMDLKDALAALNRACLFRIRILKDVYNLKRIPGIDPNWGNTKILQYLGIARSSTLDIIRNLRNQVEHELNDPPSREACTLYLDTVWYFLRSTDSMVSKLSKGMWILGSEDSGVIMTIFCAPPDWKIQIECFMDCELISDDKPMQEDAWIPLECQVNSRSGEVRGVMRDQSKVIDFVRLYFKATHTGM